jgi:hypothetical protein
MITIFEKNKFYGKGGKYHVEYLTKLMEISMLIRKDEIHQHYFFLKCFLFLLEVMLGIGYTLLHLGQYSVKMNVFCVLY